MSDQQILERLFSDTRSGSEIWYVMDLELTREEGFAVFEPTPEGMPWMIKGGIEIFTKLKTRIPQLTKVWIVPGDVGDKFLAEQVTG